MNKKKFNKKIRMIDKDDMRLLKKYPFLIPKVHWYTCKPLTKNKQMMSSGVCIKDDIPYGWWKRFGIQMCEELKKEFDKHPFLDRKFKILQAKEKYGQMRIYTSGGTKKIDEIIDKYSHISETTCFVCGELDCRHTNKGWILPVCKRCFDEEYSGLNHDYLSETSDDLLVDGKTPNSYSYRKLENNEWREYVVDVSEELEKLR